MTVAELIEELKQLPPGHQVLLPGSDRLQPAQRTGIKRVVPKLVSLLNPDAVFRVAEPNDSDRDQLEVVLICW